MLSPNEISKALLIGLVFVTFGFVNALLLSPLNPLRGAYWNLHDASGTTCSVDHEWILNWLALEHFHVTILVASFAYVVQGNVMNEDRLVWMCQGMIVVYLANGIFMIDFLNRSIAPLQGLISVGFLGFIAFYQSSHERMRQIASVAQKEYRSIVFEAAKQEFGGLRTSIATIVQFVFSATRIATILIGGGRIDDGFLGASSDPVYKIISSAVISEMMLIATTLLSVLWLQPQQQKRILRGHTIALFISLVFLSGWQGEMMNHGYLQARGMEVFVSMVFAVVGAL